MKNYALIALLTAISANVLAAPESYVIDSKHTLPRFSYSHFGYSKQLSRFDQATGTIIIDRAAKTGSVEVTIDTTSVNTGNATFNEHIRGDDFLATAKYPTAVFKSTKFNFTGDVLSSVDGDLTLKGITKPVHLTITSFQCMPHPLLKKDACGANATTMVKRTDFNMGKYAPNVGDEVTLDIPIEAVKE